MSSNASDEKEEPLRKRSRLFTTSSSESSDCCNSDSSECKSQSTSSMEREIFPNIKKTVMECNSGFNWKLYYEKKPLWVEIGEEARESQQQVSPPHSLVTDLEYDTQQADSRLQM